MDEPRYVITWDYQGSIPVTNKRKTYIYEYNVHYKNSKMAYFKNVYWGLIDILNVKLHVK
jgi:hypothetical protein